MPISTPCQISNFELIGFKYDVDDVLGTAKFYFDRISGDGFRWWRNIQVLLLSSRNRIPSKPRQMMAQITRSGIRRNHFRYTITTLDFWRAVCTETTFKVSPEQGFPAQTKTFERIEDS